MMGLRDEQMGLYHTVQIEELVPAEHPFRRIRPLISDEEIRKLCAPYYSADNGRPSVPPEQLFLAMVGGYLLGARSDRKLVMELKCNMAFRWFVGLDIDSAVWDDTTFSKARTQRFDETDVLERLFDETVKQAMARGWVSLHWSADGTLTRADASQKSFVAVEVLEKPEEYRKRMKAQGSKSSTKEGVDKTDRGNPDVDWRGEKRSNATHRSTSDEDARLGTKSFRETPAPVYQVNGIMENRHRILMGINVERFQGPRGESEGFVRLLKRAKARLKLRPKTVGADKGYFSRNVLEPLKRLRIKPHIAVIENRRQGIHRWAKRFARSVGYGLSQRKRKEIEEIWGEGKEYHGLRRFHRRGLARVRQNAWLTGWLLNLKRLASLNARYGLATG